MIDALGFFVIASGILATVYVKLTLDLARKTFIAKSFQATRRSLDSLLECIKKTLKLIDRGDLLEAGASFSCFHSRAESFADTGSRSLFLIAYALANAKSLGEVFHETWSASSYQRSGVVGSIQEKLTNLEKDVSSLRKEIIFVDLSKLIYVLITGEKWEGDNIVARAEFLRDIAEVKQTFEIDTMDETSLEQMSNCLWSFIYKWTQDKRDSIAFCIAVLLESPFRHLETLYYEMTPSSKRLYREYFKTIRIHLDTAVRGLETEALWDVLGALSDISAEAYQLISEHEKNVIGITNPS